jgi:hypothetical protein
MIQAQQQTLNICAADGKPLAIFVSMAGSISLSWVTDRMRSDAEKWLDQGLSEWISTSDGFSPRLTPATQPDFLPRLQRYLENQFSFKSSLVYQLLSTTPALTTSSDLPLFDTFKASVRGPNHGLSNFIEKIATEADRAAA